MSRVLVVTPKGGLCNRLLAVASALRLARLHNRELVLNWVADSMCGCRFEDIFTDKIPKPTEEMMHTTIRSMDIAHYFTPHKHRGVDAAGYVPILRVTSYSMFYDLSEQDYMLQDKDKSENPTLQPISEQWMTLKDSLQELKPIPLIADSVQALTDAIPYQLVGIHARRGDHVRSFSVSTDEKFVSCMTKALESNPAIGFFVATDSNTTLNLLLDKFGEKIYHYKKPTLTRKHKSGIICAAVDLYALARCENVRGSFGSSFSLIAAIIGNLQLEWVT